MGACIKCHDTLTTRDWKLVVDAVIGRTTILFSKLMLLYGEKAATVGYIPVGKCTSIYGSSPKGVLIQA